MILLSLSALVCFLGALAHSVWGSRTYLQTPEIGSLPKPQLALITVTWHAFTGVLLVCSCALLAVVSTPSLMPMAYFVVALHGALALLVVLLSFARYPSLLAMPPFYLTLSIALLTAAGV